MLPESKGELTFILRCFEKILPEYIYDISSYENNSMTLPEVMTLIDGVTVGDHKIEDEQMILNLKCVYKFIISSLETNSLDYINIFKTIHNLSEGKFTNNLVQLRQIDIHISETLNYICPPASELQEIWNNNFNNILNIENKFEMCINMFLFLVYNQFLNGNNTRTARIFVNYLAISNRIGIFKIPYSCNTEFKRLLINFFNTENREKISQFLLDKCFIRFNGGDYSKRQILSDRFNIWSHAEFLELYHKEVNNDSKFITEQHINVMYEKLIENVPLKNELLQTNNI